MALQPPFYDPPTVDYPTGQQHSQAWTEYHQGVTDQLAASQAATAANADAIAANTAVIATNTAAIAAESAFWASLAASPSYADDTAAAAGGVAVGGRYRSGSAVMVRVS